MVDASFLPLPASASSSLLALTFDQQLVLPFSHSQCCAVTVVYKCRIWVGLQYLASLGDWNLEFSGDWHSRRSCEGGEQLDLPANYLKPELLAGSRHEIEQEEDGEEEEEGWRKDRWWGGYYEGRSW